jgi:acetoin utilization deacetylase AcuC-like enzyme
MFPMMIGDKRLSDIIIKINLSYLSRLIIDIVEFHDRKHTLWITGIERHFYMTNLCFLEEGADGVAEYTELFEPNKTYIVSGTNNPLIGSTRRKTGLVYDEKMTLHCDPKPFVHVEKPQRITEMWRLLEHEKFTQMCKIVPGRPATEEELLLCHSEQHIQAIRSTATKEPKSGESYYNQHSFEAALYSCGSVIELCDRVMSGDIENGFAVVRPPGHHCAHSKSSGFGFFNNVAVAARCMQNKYGLERVLIVDWDVHHGDGTQAIFEEDPSVLYFSTHRTFMDFYPRSGYVSEVGEGNGIGKTINVAFEKDFYGDGEILAAFSQVLLQSQESLIHS